MPDLAVRGILAGGLALALGGGLLWSRRLPRDLALGVYAVAVVVLGIFAWLGPLAAAIGGAVVAVAFVIGALVYGLLALASHWASR
jgi:hypothetical protein